MGEIFSKAIHGDPHQSYEMPNSAESRTESYRVHGKSFDNSRQESFKEIHPESYNDTAKINSKELCTKDSELVGLNLINTLKERRPGIMTRAEAVAKEFGRVAERSSHILKPLTQMPSKKLTDQVSVTMTNNMKLMEECIKRRNSIDEQIEQIMPAELREFTRIIDKSEMDKGGKSDSDADSKKSVDSDDDDEENDEPEQEELAEEDTDESEKDDNDESEKSESDANAAQDDDDDDA